MSKSPWLTTATTPGRPPARKALPILLGQGLSIRQAALPKGQDPDSLRLEAGPEAVEQIIGDAPDAVTAELERLVPRGVKLDPSEQGKAAEAVAEILRTIPDPIVRSGYSRFVSDRLDVAEQQLWQKVQSSSGRQPPGRQPPGRPSPTPQAPQPSPKESLPWTLEGSIPGDSVGRWSRGPWPR